VSNIRCVGLGMAEIIATVFALARGFCGVLRCVGVAKMVAPTRFEPVFASRPQVSAAWDLLGSRLFVMFSNDFVLSSVAIILVTKTRRRSSNEDATP